MRTETETESLTGGEGPLRRKMSAMGAAMLAGTWAEDMAMLEPTINILGFIASPLSVEALANAVEKHLWPCHRFHSCMVEGSWVRRHTTMDRSYHFKEVSMPDEKAIDSWAQTRMMKSLDRNQPPWQVTLLHAPPGSRSAMFWQLHHSIGDGLGLLFAFSPMLDCEGGDVLSKIPLPAALLPKEKRKPEQVPQEPEAVSPRAGPRSCWSRVLDFPVLRFMQGALVPVLLKHDSELALNAPLAQRTPYLRFNGHRVYTRFPPADMSVVKKIKDIHRCSVNDVLMAALTGALRRYGAEVRKDPKLMDGGPKLEFKSMIMMALPRPLDSNDLPGSLANKMLFASCPLAIDQSTPLQRLDRTIGNFRNLKSKPFIAGVIGLTNFVKEVAPKSLLRKVASETFSKHSLLVTNVPCTSVPISFPKEGGVTINEVHMIFPNIITQVSIMTYNGHVNANLVADPELFPEPEALGRFWLDEFDLLARTGPLD